MNIMNTGIYAIKNLVNGKVYIGSACNFRSRFTTHKVLLRKGNHHSKKLQNSWKKHGEKNFIFEKLIVCKKDDLIFYEQLAIDSFNSVNAGYNIAPIAGSALGVRHTEEAKAKMSLSRTGNKHPNRKKPPSFTEEHRKNIGEFQIGRKRSPESIAKTAAANTGRKNTPEQNAKISAAKTGKKQSPESRIKRSITMKETLKLKKDLGLPICGEDRIVTEETRKKLSEAALGRTHSDESKEKMSLGRKALWDQCNELGIPMGNSGKKHSDETRAKMSDSAKGRVISTEQREKIGNASRGRIASDETRAKISAAKKGKKRNPEATAKGLATKAAKLAAKSAPQQESA